MRDRIEIMTTQTMITETPITNKANLNGFTNHETQLFSLFIFNTRKEYDMAIRGVRNYSQYGARGMRLVESFSNRMKSYYADIPRKPECEYFLPIYAELLNNALANVDWKQLAMRLVEDAGLMGENS